jgi:hypothetical protein
MLNEGILMPSIKIDRTFENDTWLVVEDRLINKIDGTVYWLKPNDDAILPTGVAEFYYGGTVVYDCEFEESTVKLHTFLTDCSVYYECIFTFDYEGKETDRLYVGDPLSREEVQVLYQEKTHDIEAFSFYVLGNGAGRIWDRFTSITKEETSAEKRAILNFAENLYESQSDGAYYQIEGLAKSMGDEIWFSMSGTDRRDSVKADPLISGIRENQIVSYNRATNEFRTVFEYDKKRAQIIDFDKNGAYILDSNGKFSFVEFETKKSTMIHAFSGIDHITVNDKYIFVKYQLNGYTCFVYEKGGAVIANDSSLD